MQIKKKRNPRKRESERGCGLKADSKEHTIHYAIQVVEKYCWNESFVGVFGDCFAMWDDDEASDSKKNEKETKKIWAEDSVSIAKRLPSAAMKIA